MEGGYMTFQETKECRPMQIESNTNSMENNKQQEIATAQQQIQECNHTTTLRRWKEG